MLSPACWSSSEQQDDSQVYHPNFLISVILLGEPLTPSSRSLMNMLDNITYHKIYRKQKRKNLSAPREHQQALPALPASPWYPLSLPMAQNPPLIPLPGSVGPCPSDAAAGLISRFLQPCPAKPWALLSQSTPTSWGPIMALACPCAHNPAQPPQVVSDPGSPPWAWSWPPPACWHPIHPSHHGPVQPSLNLVLALAW